MDSFIFDADDTDRKKRRIVKAIMNPPKDLGGGIAAMGDAFAYRAAEKKGAFPSAPGNSPFAGIGKLMGMVNKRGLY